MRRSFRAAALTAVAFAFATAASLGGPSFATEAEGTPSVSYVEHAASGLTAANLGLNDPNDSAVPETPELAPELIEVLQEYEWPGNVRELENLIERLVVLSSGPSLGIEFVPEKMLRALPGTNVTDETTLEGAVAALKRKLIINALHTEGNKVAAAKRLGISRSYLHRLINEFDI